jgi:hypothetical protein
VVLAAIAVAGGFRVRPLAVSLAPAGEIFRHNLPVGGQCLLALFGAYPSGAEAGPWPGFWYLHLAGAALALAGIGAGVRAAVRGGTAGAADRVSEVLLCAIVLMVGAFLVTQRVADVSSAREIAPVLPFAAALAGRQLAPVLGRPFARPAVWVLCAVGAGYLSGLGAELAAPSASPQASALTAWLERHKLPGTGLGGYWQASVVTLTSGGTVAIRPVDVDDGRVVPHGGEVNAAWYQPARSAAHFVVLFPGLAGYPGFSDVMAARATWGAPMRVYHAGAYTIWYWPKNLLRTLGH